MSYIFSDFSQVADYARITPLAEHLSAHLPGKFTFILESNKGDGETIGVRIPDNEFCRALATAYGPITATSANISGEDVLSTVTAVLKHIPEGVSLAIDGGVLYGPGSTVVDVRVTLLWWCDRVRR